MIVSLFWNNCSKILCNLYVMNLKFNQDMVTSGKRSVIIKLCRRFLKLDIPLPCRRVTPPSIDNETLVPTQSQVMFSLCRRPFCQAQDSRSYTSNMVAYEPMPGEPTQAHQTKVRRVGVNSRRACSG